MAVLLVIAALVSLSAPGLASSCSKKIEELAPHEDHVCIAFDNLTDKNAGPPRYKPSAEDISITVLNYSTGVAEVKFPLAPSSTCDSYKLSLFVLEGDMTDEECQTTRSEFLRHSVKFFDVFNCSEILTSEGEAECSPSCSRMGVVKFSYVFSGCYYVRLTPSKNGKDRSFVNSRRANVHTGYEKQTLWGAETTCHSQCFPGNQEVRITFISDYLTELPMAVDLADGINMSLGDGACANSGHDHSCCAVHPRHTGDLECESKVSSPTKPNNCSLLTNGHIECTFSNILPGNYCVTFIPHDTVRCWTGTTWTMENGNLKNCNYAYKFHASILQLIPSDPTRCNVDSPTWTADVNGHLKTCIINCRFDCPEEEKTEHLPAKIPVNNNKDGIFITVGALLSIAIIGAVVYLIARKHFKPRPVRMISVMDSVMSAVQSSNPQVLLLYAQDCNEFMQLMTTFRHLLTNVGHCKVLDCFDPARAEEIAMSPVDWIRRWVSSPEVKVVVIASDCAVAQQKALSRSLSLSYKEPLPNSHLFRYGLQEVTYNHDYTNTFVVRFDEKDLSYLTPYTRYVLPLHLQELLRSLNPSLDVSCVGEYKDEQKFRDEYGELMNYKRQNPDYLMHLMTKSGD